MTGWIRERRELAARVQARATEQAEIDLGAGRTVSVSAETLRDMYAALMPEIAEKGSVTLTFGTPGTPERPSGLIRGSERRGRSRSLDQIVSVRFASRLVADIHQRAEASGVTISDWLRIAAGRQIAAEDTPATPADLRATGWQCAHLTITASAGVLSDIRAHCGCEMRPVYASAA